MTTDIKELAQWLRNNGDSLQSAMGLKHIPFRLTSAADALEAMAGEVERLKAQVRFASETDPAMRAEAAEAERDRLKVALKLWQDAWATGRNEPMAIAANVTRNELGGDAS